MKRLSSEHVAEVSPVNYEQDKPMEIVIVRESGSSKKRAEDLPSSHLPSYHLPGRTIKKMCCNKGLLHE